MTEKMQADDVLSRQAVFVRCCPKQRVTKLHRSVPSALLCGFCIPPIVRGCAEVAEFPKSTNESEVNRVNEEYSKWYEEFKVFMQLFDDSELFGSLDSLLQSSVNTFAFNKKLMQKAIDVSWVAAIENGLPHLDTVLRNPRKTIEDVEEVVPIALSRKITVESVKHLAQHTDLIQSIDKQDHALQDPQRLQGRVPDDV